MAAHLPTYIGKGAFQSGSASLSVPMPANLRNDDLLMLFVESANQTIATPSGWTEVTNSPQGTGTAAAAGGVRLAVFWKLVRGLEANVTVADSGDHTTAIIANFRGVDINNPINITAGSTGAASTSMVFPSVTTTTTNTLVVLAAGMDTDAASTTTMGTVTNANLTGITEIHDQTVATGVGGGLAIAYGNKATAGSTGTSTATGSTSVTHAYLTIALQGRDPVVRPVAQYLKSDFTTAISTGGSSSQALTDGIALMSEYSPGAGLDELLTPKMEVATVGNNLLGTATVTNDSVEPESSDTTSSRRGGTMIYDAKNDRYIYFGGYDGTTRYNDVWEIDMRTPGNPWRKMTTTGTAPTAKNLAAATYVRATDAGAVDKAYMIIWGGNIGASDTNEMHVLDISTRASSYAWTVVTQTSAPSARSYITGHLVTGGQGTDSTNKYVYLFGGWAASRENGLHRFTFDVDTPSAVTWTTLLANGTGGNPTVRSGAIMGYKSSTSKLYLFGGYSGSAYLNDFWEYDIAGNTWTNTSPTGTAPTATELGAGGYDPTNNRFWYAAGWTNGTQAGGVNNIGYISDVGGSEAYNEARTASTENQHYAGHSSPAFCVDTKRNWLVERGMMTIDSTERYSYIIDFNDGQDSGYKPVYSITEAENLTGRDARGSVYNHTRSEYVQVGGFGNMSDDTTIATGTHLGDVWAWSLVNDSWRFANKGFKSLPQTEGSTCVYDSKRDRIIVFGGLSGITKVHNSVYSLTADEFGNYTCEQLNPSGTLPNGRWLASGMYDAINDRAVFCMGGNNSGPINEVWELSFTSSAQGAWTQRTPTGSVTGTIGPGYTHKKFETHFATPALDPYFTNWGGVRVNVAYNNLVIETNTSSNYYGVNTPTQSLVGGFVMTGLAEDPGTSIASLEVELQASIDANNRVFMVYSIVGGVAKLIAYKEVSGVLTNITSTNFNFSTMKYWRIRETSGTTYWEYSGDKQTWTALTSQSNPITMSAVYTDLDAGTASTESSTKHIKFSEFTYYSPLLYIFGGATNGALTTVSSQLVYLDVTTTATAWTTPTSSSGTARRTPSLGWDPLNNRLITFGGFNGSASIQGLQFWNAGTPGAWSSATPTTDQPDARRSLGGSFYEGKFNIMSGRSDSDRWYRDTWQLTPNYGTPNSSTWSEVKPRAYLPFYSLYTGTAASYHWQSWITEDSTDSTKVAYPFTYVAGTFYFDASDAATSDPDSNWTNDANAFDGSTSTLATPTSSAGSTSTNFLHGQGTNAPSSGPTIVSVRARLYGQYNGSESQGTGAIYTDGLGELLGTVSADNGQGAGSYTGFGNWGTLTTPTGGWTWAKIQNLEVKLYKPGAVGAQGVHRVEVEVTAGNIETTGNIQYISSAAAEGTTLSMPTHQTGDLLIMFAGRDDSTTAPTVPGGWSQPSSPTNTGTTTAMTVAYKWAASSSETSGTWTNAGALACHVIRGASTAATAPIIKHAGANGTSTTVNYSGATMSEPGYSWGLRASIHAATDTTLSTAPSGYTNRANNTTPSVMEIATFDTNGVASTIVFAGVSVGGTSNNWVSQSLEILRANTPADTDFTLASAVSSYTRTHTTDALKRKAFTPSHTTDANKKVSDNTRSHTTDALKRQQFTLTHTTDANKRKATTVTHTTDANKKKSGLTVSHTTDANKKKSGLTVSHTTDALLKTVATKTHTTDAYLSKPLPTVVDFNGDFEDYPVDNSAATNTATRWIDGTAGGSTTRMWYWAIPGAALAGTANAQFDTSVKHSGNASMRLTNPDTSSSITVSSFRNNPPNSTQLAAGEGFVILPSQTYRVEGWIKTNNVASNAAFIDLRQFSSAGTNLATTSSTKLTGTNDWTKVSFEVTTNASAAYGTILIRNNVTGNISDAWYDDLRVVAVYTKTHTTDALKRKATTVSHTTSANKRLATVKTHTTDALKRKTNTLTHTTDANKRAAITKTHTTDALLRKQVTNTHTTDANKRKATTVAHTTDSNKRKAQTVSHTTDAYLGAALGGRKKILVTGVWTAYPVKVYNGSTWDTKLVKYFNGSAWVLSDA